MLSPDKKEVWGRLLMTDDGGKKIWRISYKANQTSADSR